MAAAAADTPSVPAAVPVAVLAAVPVTDDIYVLCPRCTGCVVVARAQLNCRIFRHAVLKATLQPIHPHAPREMCDALVAADAIVGCAAPFQIVQQPDGTFTAVACDYI